MANKINKVSNETREKIRKKSVLNLPNRIIGNPELVKQAFTGLVIDSNNSALGEIDRVVDEVNALFDYYDLPEIKQMIDEGIIEGDLKSFIEEKLTEKEQEYAPRLNNLEQNKADKTALQALASGSPKGTYANLAALQSAIPDGDNNIYITLDNGHWNYHNGTSWVSGGVYQSTGLEKNSVGEDEVSFIEKPNNLFDGVYVARHIYGSIANGGVLVDTNSNARSAIIPIEPNKTYTITKELSDRFRIAVHTELPVVGTTFSRYIKDEFTSDESQDTVFTFTSNENENYLCIVVSANSEEPVLIVEESAYSTVDLTELNFAKKLKAPNIIMSKNIFNGEWITGTLTASPTLMGELTTNNGKLAIIPIKPNTTYTVSKSYSNRLKIGLSQIYPRVGIKDVRVIYEDNLQSEHTFTTLENDKYLVVYVAFEAPPPSFMQVEIGENKTSWETYGYKFYPSSYPVSTDSNGSEDEDILSKYGIIGDGISDDTNAIQALFNDYKNKTIKLPSGTFKITKTLYIGSNTIIEGNTNSTFILGDGYTLDGVMWRGSPTGAYAIMRTQADAKGVIVRNIKIIGNKTQFTDHRQFGLAFVDCENCVAENVEIEYINYFPEEAIGAVTNALGWNLAILRAKNIRINGGKYTYGGYECIGTEASSDIVFNGVYCGIGWRTSLQLHRGTKNTKVIGCTIEQNHPTANSALTLHGEPDEEVEHIQIVNTYINSITDNLLSFGGGIQTVKGCENYITINSCNIMVNNIAIHQGSVGTSVAMNWIIFGNNIASSKYGIKINNTNNLIIKDNIVDTIQTAIEYRGLKTNVNDNLLINNQTIQNNPS